MRGVVVALVVLVAGALNAAEVTDRTTVSKINGRNRVCSEASPASMFDRPSCSDHDLTTSLIESAERGDHSALALLQKRYRAAGTYSERNRIGRVLLAHLDDDQAIWNELAADAGIVVSFPQTEPRTISAELESYCEQRNLDPAEIWLMSYDALRAISGDARSRPLLYRALDTADGSLVLAAITGLAGQRDASALPAIERALARFQRDDASVLAKYLSGFESPEAEKLLAMYREE